MAIYWNSIKNRKVKTVNFSSSTWAILLICNHARANSQNFMASTRKIESKTSNHNNWEGTIFGAKTTKAPFLYEKSTYWMTKYLKSYIW